MKISEYGIHIIKHFEGVSLRAYQCSSGVWTIGYGHTAGVSPGDIINEVQAEDFLREDIVDSENVVNMLVTVPLRQSQFDALVSFVFNLGSGNFRSSTLLKKVNAGDHTGAAEEFLRWVNAAGRPLPGLIRRRKAERNLYVSV